MPLPLPDVIEPIPARPTAEQVAALRGAVRRFIGARVRNPAVADDVTQDVFVKVLRQLPHVRDPRRIIGWIFQIARHEIADHFRRARTNPPSEEVDEVPSSAHPTATADEEKTLRDNLAGYIRSVVKSLPDPYREALLLTEEEGLTQVELAQRIRLSVSAAKSRVQRARAMVKGIIDQCCHFDLDPYGRVIDCRPKHCRCGRSRAHSERS